MDATLADHARQLAREYPARSPERRAAAALHTALVTTKTADAARRALDTFGDASTRAAAQVLLDGLQREAA